MRKARRDGGIRRAGLGSSGRSGDPSFSPRWGGLGFAAPAGFVAALASTSPQAQTLTQALADTYNTNPQLLAQRALLRATDEQVPQALANWRPTVNFTGQVGGARAAVTRPSTGLANPGGSGAYSTLYENTLNLQVTQPIYTG